MLRIFLVFLSASCTLVAKDPPTGAEATITDKRISTELSYSLTNAGLALGQLTRIIDLLDQLSDITNKEPTASGADSLALLSKSMSEVGVLSLERLDGQKFVGVVPSLVGKEYNTQVSFVFEGEYQNKAYVKEVSIRTKSEAADEEVFPIFSMEKDGSEEKILLNLDEVMKFQSSLLGNDVAERRRFTSGQIEIIRAFDATFVQCSNLKWISRRDIRELSLLKFQYEPEERTVKNFTMEGRVFETETLKELGSLSMQVGTEGEAIIRFVDKNGTLLGSSPLP